MRSLFKVRADFDRESAWDDDGVGCTRRSSPAGAKLGLPPSTPARSHASSSTARASPAPQPALHPLPRARRRRRGGLQRHPRKRAPPAPSMSRGAAARRRRSDLLEERLREADARRHAASRGQGAAVGQINGLAVAELGDHRFGHPVRISATAGPGEGASIDIEREAALSGPRPHQGRPDPRRLPARPLLPRNAAHATREPGLRAVLRSCRGRLAPPPPSSGAAVGARRRADAPGHRRHRLGGPARPIQAGRRRQREDRGLLRPVPRARTHRRTRRGDPGDQPAEPDARAELVDAVPRGASTSGPSPRSTRPSSCSPASAGERAPTRLPRGQLPRPRPGPRGGARRARPRLRAACNAGRAALSRAERRASTRSLRRRARRGRPTRPGKWLSLGPRRSGRYPSR